MGGGGSLMGALHVLFEMAVTLLALAMLCQALVSLYMMLYAWENPERLAATAGPARFLPPRLSFTLLVPARHEEAVIAATIRRLLSSNYPTDLVEVVVVCHANDVGTIAAARQVEVRSCRARVETFTSGPINKPHGLNVGLRRSSREIVAVFDAEDDVHPDILNAVNTVMLQERVGVVQAGVQLMNFRDHWFSVHNCLEYFFWFKSRLHFHAAVGMIPLGGNTVFMRRELVERVGGWDEACLTEDADIGLRLSVLGQSIRVVYNSRWATREETPNGAKALVRQRTRWHQGFLQVLRKGDWRVLPRRRQRALALLTLGQPLMDAALVTSLPLMVVASLRLHLPVPIALLSLCPLYAVAFQLLANLVGAVLFAREFGQVLPAAMLPRILFTYLPYQWLLGLSALRATVREARGHNNWEKTEHFGAHRVGVPAGLVTHPRSDEAA
jgi:cellulose synthase/poly-beta-1,6-N-acetylglucosamine synthase-like glycosyltransferase